VKVRLRKTRSDQSSQHPPEGDEGNEDEGDDSDEGNGTVSVRHDVPTSPYRIRSLANFIPSNRLRFSRIRDSRKRVGIAIVRVAREGRPNLSSYYAAKSNSRLFVN
jgi:hypothetical protein